MTYAGIGSRKTPPETIGRMVAAAERLARMGYTLRSGGADGADVAFERGADVQKEIYLPWADFNSNPSGFYPPLPEAFDIAASLHPAWDRLSHAAKKLMARNSHQILGADLRSPSRFVICWTPCGAECESDRTSATGGTGQAITLASRHGIAVFNLAKPDAGERLLAFLKSKVVPIGSH